MKTRMFQLLSALMILSMLISACGGAAQPTQAPAQPTAAPAQPTAAPAAVVQPTAAPASAAAGVIEAKPGQSVDMTLLPKFMGNAVFDEANAGAVEAQKELQNPGKLNYVGPTADNSVAGQIEIVTNAPTQGVKALMISNNAGDQIGPAAEAARTKGLTVVTWDSPIPSAQGEQVFIAQVDFKETGTVLADMVLDILGAEGGKFAVLSASPDAANQNAWIAAMKDALKDPKYAKLQLVDVVYGNDQSEMSYNQTLALIQKYPDLKLITAPTTVGIASAAKALQDEKLCDKVKISGLGLPSEMVAYTKNGCAPEFALWSFVDLGYLTYYTTYLIATGQMEAKEGVQFKAGRMGTYTITKDPTRDQGLRVLMGPFTKYTKDNVESGGAAPAPAPAAVIEAKPGQSVDMTLLPKFMGNAVFDEANAGAVEAQKELQNPGKLNYVGPTADNSVAGQIEIVTNAPTQGVKALMISNNAGDQIGPAAEAARTKGLTVVTWDSPIPSAQGEQVFIAQVDFKETGTVLADMVLDILGAEGGKFAVLSASPDAANQNAWIAAMKDALKDPKYAKLQLVDVVYGNDQSEMSYNQTLALIQKYPDLKLITAPTTVGIASAAKALQDEKLCDKVKISGLGLPSEMVAYTKNGCAPEFALWSFVDLGYLTYYTTYLIATGQMEAKEGVQFKAGRMGTYTITKDPTRDQGLRVLMGPFTKYTKDNVESGGAAPAPAPAAVIEAKPGQSVDMTLLPKFMGNAVFDEANAGAVEAQKELQNPGKLNYVGPTADNSVAGQIEIVTNAPTQGVKALMISNNAGDQIGPAAEAARTKGLTVVTWDSPIPSAQGEQVFIAQVDFKETGTVLADMVLDILGAEGGKFAVLSASPDAANQNAWIAAMKDALKDPKYAKLQLVDVVYGNDQSEMSYNQTLALIQKYPDLKLITAPTTVGIASAAKALQDEKLCDKVKISGLGLPSEMVAYTKNGCAPEFALWSFVDLGYLTYYTTYLIATGQMEAKEGVQFEAGRMGTYTITKDPTREKGLRVLMGPFTRYTKDNVQ